MRTKRSLQDQLSQVRWHELHYWSDSVQDSESRDYKGKAEKKWDDGIVGDELMTAGIVERQTGIFYLFLFALCFCGV